MRHYSGDLPAVAELLAGRGIQARVVDVIAVKPLDREPVLRCAYQAGALVTAENVDINGGLGSRVAQVTAGELLVPVLSVAVEDEFGCVETEAFLR